MQNSKTSKLLLVDIPVSPFSVEQRYDFKEQRLRNMLNQISKVNYDGFWERKNKLSYSRGVLMLGEALLQDGHDVVYWAPTYNDIETIINDIKSFDICGISCATPFIRHAYEIAEKLKVINPSIVIVLGGYHGTALCVDVLKECKFIDIVVRGRGEVALKAIANHTPLSNISNLCYRDNGTYIIGRIDKFKKGKIYAPNYSLLNNDINSYRVNLQTQIGCNHDCIFCANWVKKTIKIPMQSLIDEWTQLKSLDSNSQIHFCDTNFIKDIEYARKICSLLPNYFSNSTRFSCDVRGDSCIDSKSIKIMENAGFNRICIGFETSNDKILQRLGKGLGFEDNIAMAKKIRSNSNICIYAYWIFGLPFQTYEQLEYDIEIAASLIEEGLVDEVSASVKLIPLPGSKLFSNPNKYKVSFSKKSDKLFRIKKSFYYHTEELSIDELSFLYQKYIDRMIIAYKKRYKFLQE